MNIKNNKFQIIEIDCNLYSVADNTDMRINLKNFYEQDNKFHNFK